MNHYDDAKKFDAIKADAARGKQLEAERHQAAQDRDAVFAGGVDQIFGPIFRAKAEALHRPDDPVTLGQRAMFYRGCTLYYKPLRNEVLWEIGGQAVDQHHREQTRGNYVYLGLIQKVLDHRVRGWVEKDVKGIHLRAFSRSEPFWGRVTRQENVAYGEPYEGSRRETRRTYFPVEAIPETTDKIVQGFVEAMVRCAG
jgi:hypothetical protein